jgi:hypothetical protein
MQAWRNEIMTDQAKAMEKRVADAIGTAWEAMHEIPFPLYEDEKLSLAKAAILAVSHDCAGPAGKERE